MIRPVDCRNSPVKFSHPALLQNSQNIAVLAGMPVAGILPDGSDSAHGEDDLTAFVGLVRMCGARFTERQAPGDRDRE